MDKRDKRYFIITVRILEISWDYKVGDTFRVPILSNSAQNAEDKFYNNYWGSEFPEYEIIDIEDNYDSFLFAINIKNKHNNL